ncbi:TonB-dependent receptor [Algoriphagus pacificus]|uniref:TonB-dependent receptor plug domain-containing protein n=1 Tax=Algoriphagus pacificus TaxID=2811234 RepID=A0ABS3CDR7_9BACT|nr:TonB-dependent receptor [Algoriphagus pacificus]MBN7815247.1 TonB-dependent receptor plug domain-containing protein [Algoriphagus pacificus]
MILFLWVVSLFGFIPTPQDTVILSEVEVYAPALDRFAQGQKVISWSKKDLMDFEGRALADLLQEQSPVFVRQYGAGMLASPSFRGTSAGHTALFWNGLPINSPSLGQSDLSILPMAAIDQLSLQFGNAGALFGNEAIGGSVHLLTVPEFGKEFHASIGQQFGSFGKYNTHLKASYSTDDLSLSTKVYREFSKNNFPYMDLGQISTPLVKEDHAAFEQKGIVQDLAWNFDSNHQLKAAFWFNQADREIQPVMGSNTQDMQSDQSLRAALDYFRFGNHSVLNLKIGMVKDELLFNESLSKTGQFFVGGDWDQVISDHWTIKGGLRFTQVQADLSTYSTSDQRIESYQSAKFKASDRLAFSLNLRELIYQDQWAPFTPSLGMDWVVIQNEKQELLLKSSVGKGFKVPTLNDRFWEPGGNPNLLPEESTSGEIGFAHQFLGEINWSNSITYYRMSVDNWIIWLPQGSVWTPDNIRNVSNQGIEYEGAVKGKLGAWDWKLIWSYSWNRAVSTKGIGESDPAIGKQLPYTPQHQANGQFNFGNNAFRAFLGSFFVGERSVTADNPRLMPSYQLFNGGVSFNRIQWGKLSFPVSFQVNNIFNKNYQVLYLRAMPGRSFQFNLSINL